MSHPPAPAHGVAYHDGHDDGHDRHGHTHGLVDASIKRSREGIRVVLVSLAILALTTVVQALLYATTDSVALLADLIHNAGDALTAVPLGIAFVLRSARAERWAGLAVVFAIFISAVTAGVFAVERLIGNTIAARVRTSGGRRLNSAALIADGKHAQSDAIVSVGVVLSAVVVALGAPIADPIIGLLITGLILRITWQSWNTMRAKDDH